MRQLSKTASIVFVVYTLAEAGLVTLIGFVIFIFGMGMSYQSAGSCLFTVGILGLFLGLPGAIAGSVLFRRYGHRWTVIVGAMPFGLAILATCAGLGFDNAQAMLTRRVLSAPLTAYGQTIPAGAIVADKGRDLLVTLPPGGTFASEPIAGTFEVNGSLFTVPDNLQLTLAHDAIVHGLRCLAGRPFAFVANLPSCTPPPPGIVNGVPCSTEHVATIVQPVDDRFKTFGVKCILGATFVAHGIAWPAGTLADTVPDDAHYETDAPLPGLLLFGRTLPPKSTFEFDDTASPLLMVSTSPSTFDFHGCEISRIRILRQSGSAAARLSSTCSNRSLAESDAGALTLDGKIVRW